MNLNNPIERKLVRPPTWAVPILAVFILVNPYLLFRKKLSWELYQCGKRTIIGNAYSNIDQALVFLGILYTLTLILKDIR